MKPYEEIAFPNGYLRWIREGDEYVCRMSDGYMRKMKALHESRALIPDQQRKQLTDEQIFEISNEFVLCMFPVETRTTDRELAFARAIEKAVTRQPQIRPLTDDVMWKLWNAEGNDEMNQQEAIAFARAIEAAHGIKE